MTIQIAALFLFALSVLRFVRRATQEGRRQQVLTWPRATAVLEEGEDDLVPAAANRFGETTFYHAKLQRPYTFYARGERYTGKKLAPRLDWLNGSERAVFIKELHRCRKFEVYFNPDDPEENYLTVGKPILSYGKEIVYALYGLVFPTVLWWFAADSFPHTRTTDILAIAGFIIALLLLVIYFLVQPIANPGKFLIPVSEKEAGGGAQEQDMLLKSLNDGPQALGPEKVPFTEKLSR